MKISVDALDFISFDARSVGHMVRELSGAANAIYKRILQPLCHRHRVFWV